ncbi:MAG: alpha/beta fold hydrolase, partial [Pseudomonadota bacterium]
PVTQDVEKIDPAYPPTNVELSFRSGGATLPAYLMVANGRGPHPTVVLLHGFPGNEKNLDVAQALRRANFNVLFMHYRGAWGAEGRYSIAQLPNDAIAALNFLRAEGSQYRVDALRLSLLGHSMGGFAALKAGAGDARVDCVIGLAAANLGEYASRPEEQKKGFAAYTDRLFMLNGFSGRQALDELRANARQFDLRNIGQGLSGKSVLLMTGSADTVVPPAVQERIAEAYAGISRLDLTAVEMEGADHSFAARRVALQRAIVSYMATRCR